MQRSVVLLLLLVLISGFVLPTVAQDGPIVPEPFSPADNECYAGGAMEGKCNEDINGDGVVNQQDTDWLWTCGWYVARYNDRIYRRWDVPLECHSLLPPAHLPQQDVVRQFACFLAFDGALNECILGHLLKEDAGNDGSFESRWYIASDSVVGNGGVCPGGTTYVEDVASRSGDRAFLRWLQNRGFTLTDDYCSVP